VLFKDARSIESICYQLRLSDYPRSLNRAKVNNLANGLPPYSPEEVQKNNIEINVNDLTLTRLAHDGRQQFYNANMKPGNFYTCRTDKGPRHKRQKFGTIVTAEANRVMKRSTAYFETMRSKFALNVLHGIGPAAWDNQYNWCPEALGIEDVMIPTGTLLSMKNLPFFAIHRAYTGLELLRLTKKEKRSAGWNMAAVNKALKWVDDQTNSLQSQGWPEVWSPEKMAEREKENSGLFASDIAPTIQAWDFYFYNDDKKECGWNRRIIFDCFSGSGSESPSVNSDMPNGDFLFNPGNRKYGSNLSEIIHFQFADLSAVAPFRYHAVRGLGWLSYAVCHLQNRFHCKFNEAGFETLMNYMRVKSQDEAERALSIQLASHGIIDETVKFLSPEERWQPNAQLVELCMAKNDQVIGDNASRYAQKSNFSRDPVVEKTKFQVMSELNNQTALINAALQQAYFYQQQEYREIFRRLCKPNSTDPDCREFRARCLDRGIPEEVLADPQAWDIASEQVLSPNKSMEMAIANQLMEWRNLFGPQAQQVILRQATLALTDNPGLTDELVPQTQGVSTSKEAAMLAVGSLMMGAKVAFSDAHNRIEIVEVLLAELGIIVQRINQFGGMTTPDVLAGLQNMEQTIAGLIEFIAQDKNEVQRVKIYGDDLGAISNEIKAFAQRLEEQQQASAENANGGIDPETMSKMQSDQIKAQAKAQNSRESHAQKTSQKQVAFELEQKRREAEHELEMRRTVEIEGIEDVARGIEAASKTKHQPKPETTTTE
jgi:hypothetical protein